MFGQKRLTVLPWDSPRTRRSGKSHQNWFWSLTTPWCCPGGGFIVHFDMMQFVRQPTFNSISIIRSGSSKNRQDFKRRFAVWLWRWFEVKTGLTGVATMMVHLVALSKTSSSSSSSLTSPTSSFDDGWYKRVLLGKRRTGLKWTLTSFYLQVDHHLLPLWNLKRCQS